MFHVQPSNSSFNIFSKYSTSKKYVFKKFQIFMLSDLPKSFGINHMLKRVLILEMNRAYFYHSLEAKVQRPKIEVSWAEPTNI